MLSVALYRTPAGHKGSYDLEQMRQQEEEQHQTFTFSRDLEGVFAIHMHIYKHKPYTLLIPYSFFSISLLQLPEIPTPMPSREEMQR